MSSDFDALIQQTLFSPTCGCSEKLVDGEPPYCSNLVPGMSIDVPRSMLLARTFVSLIEVGKSP